MTQLYKGIAILLIVTHNFFHLIKPRLGENEYTFSSDIFEKYIQFFTNNPGDIFRLFFSFFGHYGVEIFIFLSAYGLTLSFNRFQPTWNHFILSRIKRIYPAFIVSIVLFFLLRAVQSWNSGLASSLSGYCFPVLWKFLAISNFIPNMMFAPNGPWWFIPFIMQVYFLFPLLYIATTRHGL